MEDEPYSGCMCIACIAGLRRQGRDDHADQAFSQRASHPEYGPRDRAAQEALRKKVQ